MIKTTTNRELTVKRAVTSIAALLTIMLLLVLLGACNSTGKPRNSLSTSEPTESTDETYGRMKGVVISGRETEPTVTTVETTAPTETSEATETSAEETTEPSETTKQAAPTKAPAKKPAAKPKTTKRKTAKKKSTKKRTKKTTTSSTSNQYSYCTCDAKVNYGVSGMGASGSHTFTGLTAQRNSNGTWKLTSSATSTVTSWLNKNVKDKVGKPNWGSYSVTITNTRNLRNSP